MLYPLEQWSQIDRHVFNPLTTKCALQNYPLDYPAVNADTKVSQQASDKLCYTS